MSRSLAFGKSQMHLASKLRPFLPPCVTNAYLYEEDGGRSKVKTWGGVCVLKAWRALPVGRRDEESHGRR